MTKEVTVRQPSLPGLQPNQEVLDLAMRFYVDLWRDDFGDLSLPVLPTKAERLKLENRLRELKREFQMIKYATADGDRAMRALGKLFSGYPSLRNTDAGDLCASYVDGLCDLPAACIELAVEDIRQARVPDLDPDWPPTTPRIHKIAAAIRDKLYAKEVLPIEKVLEATTATPVINEQTKKNVSELLAGLADHLRNDDEVAIEEEQRRISTLEKQVAWERKRWDQSQIAIPGTPHGDKLIKEREDAARKRKR